MNGIPSSTFFSAPPDWGWLIALYFFFGGLAGGCYFLAVLIDLFGGPEDRPLARLGHYIAFPCIVISGFLLTVDLTRPERFWHMLIQSNTFKPIFKPWSPMSLGSWALLIFGFFAFVSFIGALTEDRRLQWSAGRKLRPPERLGLVVSIIGGLFGFYVAGYTGVLLSVTNRPIWSDTPLLGMLFIVSAASTSAALLMLLAQRYGWRGLPGVAALERMDGMVLALELLVLIAVMVSLGPALRAWLNAWGLLLVIVVLVGLIAPLVLSWRHRRVPNATLATVATLVLVGGFLLRLLVIFSSEAI
jgi:protein NrfD